MATQIPPEPPGRRWEAAEEPPGKSLGKPLGRPLGAVGMLGGAMARVLSGIQPSGSLHLGNLLGAVRNWAVDQHEADSFFCVVDYHAITVPQDPATLREATLSLARLLVASGLDPDVCTLFVQSHVPAHTELGWIMECTVSYGELRRMVQFKDKADRADFVSGGLLTYPALQAADILLYETDRVPVGEDQRQHLELARTAATRFNSRYGETFVVPEATIPKAGARVMDLQNPQAKMSKSSESPQGTVNVLDDLATVARKIRRAVTDTGSEVRYDPREKPGVSNLLSILAACTSREPEDVAPALHPVRTAQGGHGGGGRRVPPPDPGPLRGALGRPTSDGRHPGQGRRQGRGRGLGGATPGAPRHRAARPQLTVTAREGQPRRRRRPGAITHRRRGRPPPAARRTRLAPCPTAAAAAGGARGPRRPPADRSRPPPATPPRSRDSGGSGPANRVPAARGPARAGSRPSGR